MEKQVFLSENAVQTQQYAAKIVAGLMIEKGRQKAQVLALTGELGGGKTTFVQGLAKALGVREKITSPTFVIMRHFNILASRHFNNLYHIDCYRLNSPKELAEIDFKKIISQPGNLAVIEWADRIKKIVPKNAIWLSFEWVSQNQRKINRY